MKNRKEKIIAAFSGQAMAYDYAAGVQWQAAQLLDRLIRREVKPPPKRILEIGCGTGFLSIHLANAFPTAELLLTDIAESMLERCKARLGEKYSYRIIDGELPENLDSNFDLIASNLAFQWFVDLKGGLERLTSLLAPGGAMFFSTLGQETFQEWRTAHSKLNLPCGTPSYPDLADFPWPESCRKDGWEERILHSYNSGQEFVRTLKALGASEPAPGYRPLSPGHFRRLLVSLDQGIDITYHLLLGKIVR